MKRGSFIGLLAVALQCAAAQAQMRAPDPLRAAPSPADPTRNDSCADCNLPTAGLSLRSFENFDLFGLRGSYLRDEDGNQERVSLGGFTCHRPRLEENRAGESGRHRFSAQDPFEEKWQFQIEDRLLTRQSERISLECRWTSRSDRNQENGRAGSEISEVVTQLHYLNQNGGPLRKLFGTPAPSDPLNTNSGEPTLNGQRAWMSCEWTPGVEGPWTSWLSCSVKSGPGITTLTPKDLSWMGRAEISLHTPSRVFATVIPEGTEFDLTLGYLHRHYFGDGETDRNLSASLGVKIPVFRGVLESSLQALQIRDENERHTYGEWDKDFQYAFTLEFRLPIGPSSNHGSSR